MRYLPSTATFYGLILIFCLPTSPWAQDRQSARTGLDEARRQEQGILARIQEFDLQLEETRTELDNIEAEVDALQNQLARSREEAQEAQRSLAEERIGIEARIESLYRLQRSGANRMIFGSENPTDLRRRNNYLIALIESETERLVTFQQNVDNTNAMLSMIEADQAELEERQAELEAQFTSLTAQRERREALLAEVRNDEESYLALLAEQSESRQNLQQQVGDVTITQSSSSSSGTPSSSSPSAEGFRGEYGRLRWPVVGQVINRYGRYTDSNGQTVDSKGIDIAAEYGQPVRSVYAGEVQLADYVRGYGQTVAIRHGAYTTVYAHLNGIRVRQGESVDAGTVIGLVGNTGLTDADRYMLTFEIRYGATAQDPEPWLAAE